jgi:hypothetical protein
LRHVLMPLPSLLPRLRRHARRRRTATRVATTAVNGARMPVTVAVVPTSRVGTTARTRLVAPKGPTVRGQRCGNRARG